MRVVNARRALRRTIAAAAVLAAVFAAAAPAAQAQWWGSRPYDVGPWHGRCWNRPWGPRFCGPWRPAFFRPRPVFVPPPPLPPPARAVIVRPPPPPPVVYRRVIVERTRPVFLQRTVVVHAPPVVIHAPPVVVREPPIVRERIVYKRVPVYIHTPVVHHRVHHYPVIHYRSKHCGCN